MSKTRLLISSRKGLLILQNTSGGWKRVGDAFDANNVTYAMKDSRTGTMWASLDHGHWGQHLHRSDNDGETWDEVAAPAYPDDAIILKPPAEPKAKPAQAPARLENVWVIAEGGKDQPQRMYLGTNPGGLFKSDDGGETFELVRGLWDHPSRLDPGWFGAGRDTPGVHSIVVDPRESRRVLVGISVAGVFETVDDGQSWAPRNKGLLADFLPDPDAEIGHDPHFIAMFPGDPDVLWQQNHCGIFRSGDGAAVWSNISQTKGPARFGFPIATDEKDPNTAWVVPAHSDQRRVAIEGAMSVCRTEDGGASWTELREGLPQKDCYDVVYRHALDISGDTLAFGSTTGNLYLSNDRGESWTCLGNSFPPIYSVRFAD